MKQKLLLAGLLMSGVSFAQEFNPENYVQNGIVNDSKLVMDVMENQYPGYKNQVNASFEQAKLAGLAKTGERKTINTVIHVVWKEAAENLPDSVILRQMEILNEDYTRTNADTVNLRSIFEPVAGNPNIDFNVISINRVQTDATFTVDLFGGLIDAVKSSSTGGSDAWDTQQVLNIWICKIDGGLLGALFGYAYPPAGLSNWPTGSTAPNPNLEGVVLDYRTIADNNPNPYPNPQGGGNINLVGRTATHEVGHYLGLRHIWGDGGGLGGGDSCGADDGCADTPNQGAQSNFDCNTNNNTCIDPVDDLPDLIENHMDYSAETCKNMFTNDQIAIMRGVLADQREGITQEYVGLEENISNTFSMFPNPANDNLTISIEQNGSQPFEIVNVLGKVVKSGTFNGQTTLDLSTFKTGIYFVKVGDNSSEEIKKLIVRK